RIQWFLTINGFLFTAVAVFGNQPGRDHFGYVLGAVGLLVCVSFGHVLKLGSKGWTRLADLWEKLRHRATSDFVEIGVYGHRSRGVWSKFGPWFLLPYIMAAGWAGVIWFFAEHREERPPGSYSPVVINKLEQEVQVFNTSTGTQKVP